MGKYLNGYLSIIPENQKQYIIDLIQKNKTKYNLSISEEEFIQIISSIQEKHEQLYHYSKLSGRIDSTAYNAAISKISIDLQVLFSEVNLLSKAAENYSTLGNAMLADLRHEIDKLASKVTALEASVTTNETIVAINETFDTAQNMESTDSPLYLGMSTVEMSTRNKDHIITLRQVAKDYVETDSVRENPTINVTQRVGLPVNQQKPQCSATDTKCLIQNWTETAISLAPLDMMLDNVSGPGAIAKLTITFPYSQLISCISITPGGVGDIEVAAICYQTEVDLANAASTASYKYICASDSVKDSVEVLCTPNTYSSSNPMTFVFPSIVAKQVIIYIKQPNYVQERLTEDITLDDIPIQFAQGYGSVHKYTYGIKSLEISHYEYGECSCFISKPYNIDRNIAKVTLSTVEHHPILIADSSIPVNNISERDTSIEYYITNSDGNTAEQWIPILPTNEEMVINELLNFIGPTATLRFKADGSKEATLYKNGIRVSNNEWSKLQTDKTLISIDTGYDPNAVYTIDYYPTPEAYTVFLSNSYITQYIGKNTTGNSFGEVFHGTNNDKTVVLSKYPYVDYMAINTNDAWDPNIDNPPIQVYFENAYITGPNRSLLTSIAPYPTSGTPAPNAVYTKNITDYRDPDKQYHIREYDPTSYRFIEYYHKDNKLFFGEMWKYKDNPLSTENNHGCGDIRVQYSYPVTSVRIKIILRRFKYADAALTPELSSYTLKIYMRK